MSRATWIGCMLLAGCGGGRPSGGDAGTTPDLVAGADLSVRDLEVAIDFANGADLVSAADLAALPDLDSADLAQVLGMTTASLSNVMIVENCMPIVPPDPVIITASLKITNVGMVPVGPISAGGGEVLEMLKSIATFATDPVQTGVLMPGQSQTLQVTKKAGSVMPANGCATLPCNGGVNLVMPYAGPGVSNGNRAVSGLTFVTCLM